jgi:hypothetical protein
MTTTITPLTQAESEFLNMLVEHIIKTKYRSQKGKRDKIRWSVYQTLRELANSKDYYVQDTQNRLNYLFKTKEDAIVLWFMTGFTNQELELDIPLHGTNLTLSMNITITLNPNDDAKHIISAAYVDDEANYAEAFHVDQFGEDDYVKAYLWDDSDDQDYATKFTHNLKKIAKQLKE